MTSSLVKISKIVPIMLALCLMLLIAYYAYYYAGIIGRGLTLVTVQTIDGAAYHLTSFPPLPKVAVVLPLVHHLSVLPCVIPGFQTCREGGPPL